MFRSKISRFVAVVLLALSCVGAFAQTVNLAPSMDGVFNGTYIIPVNQYTGGWQAAQWPKLNRVADFEPGVGLSLQSATALSGGAKSTAPKMYPYRPQWNAYKSLPSGNYRAEWTLTKNCGASAVEADAQAVRMNVGPLWTLTPHTDLPNGTPQPFAATFTYTRVYANEVSYFTFQLDANPPKATDGKQQFGCKYSLTNLSLTAQ